MSPKANSAIAVIEAETTKDPAGGQPTGPSMEETPKKGE
jgi:hypothetical protein